MKTIFTADWILPVNGKAMRNGAILVEDGLIKDMGHAYSLSQKYQIKPQRFATSVIAPSWVNAHCHLELSYLKNKVLYGKHFVDWVQSLLQAREDFNDPALKKESFEKELEMQSKYGVALIGDVTNGDFLETPESTCERIVYYEVIGFQPDQAREIYKQAAARIAQSNGRIYLAPHAFYSTSTDLVKMILDSGRYSIIHAAESPQEMIFLRKGGGPFQEFLKKRKVWPGDWQAPEASPVQILARLGGLSDKLLLIHGVHVDSEDMGLLAQAGTRVCICMRSNVALASGLPPLPEYLKQGIPVCVGTDSLASNSDLDMNAEVAYLTECFPQISATDILAMATLNGAVALGMADRYGSLEVGKKARFNVFSGKRIKEMPPEEFVVTKAWSDLTCF